MGSSGEKGNGVVGSSPIPLNMREMVSNLKEIVNCNELEIYATLRECDMDPNEAIQRLLNQDTFHEVKSKREKKKEPKGTPESRSQRLTGIPDRGMIDCADRGGRSSVQNTSYANGLVHGKPVRNKENGTSSGVPTSSDFCYGVAANCSNASLLSSHDSMGSTVRSPGQPDFSLLSQPSSTYQHNWSGIPGQLSMADIVKMGWPQQKPSSTPTTATFPAESPEFHSSQFPALKSMEFEHVLTNVVGQTKPLEECCVVDKPPEGSGLIVSDTCVSGDYAPYIDVPSSSSLRAGGSELHLSPDVDGIGNFIGATNVESLQTEPKISDRQLEMDGSAGVSGLDDGSPENTSSYHYQRHLYNHFEAKDANEALSDAIANFQHLNLPHEEQGATPAEENRAVIIPGHLQVTNTDCSHLSFGSFGSAGASLPVAITSNLLEKDPVLVAEIASPNDQSDDRKPEHYNYNRLGAASDDNVAPGGFATSRNYDMATVPQPDVIRGDTFDVVRRHQHDIASFSSYSFPSTTQPNDAAYYHAEVKPQVQSPSLSSLLAMEPDLFSMPQPTPQIVSSNTVATGPVFPRHLPTPYSQQTLPPELELLPSTMNYPHPPQSVSYVPFSGSSPYQHSPYALQSAGMKYTQLPQYKYSIPLDNLPHSSPLAASGFGDFGISANIPGSFARNPSTVAASTNFGYEEVLRSQFKQGGHFSPLYQNEDSLWLHGAGSRTVPGVPPGMYGFQGQNQQGSSIGQRGQQYSPMGMMGYPNYYRSQAGGSFGEHQQRISRLGDTNGTPQSRSFQQSQHPWQHNY